MITLADILAFEWSLADQSTLTAQDRSEIATRTDQAMSVLQSIKYKAIPSASELHLSECAAREVMLKTAPSPGIASPMIEEARKLTLFADFKPLSDLALRNDLDRNHVEIWRTRFQPQSDDRAEILKAYIDATYTEEGTATAPVASTALHLDSGDSSFDYVFEGVEASWNKLVKEPASSTIGSALPLPYPMLVPAGRFQESYYWDTAFGVYGLLATGRLALAQMQADNFLEQVRLYGFIPNGTRDYYLSRSQPPLSSHTIRKVVEASPKDARLKRWLKDRAIPLLGAEFLEFWSDPQTRFDATTGLHHHWDALDVKRPERHSADDEAALGNTLRDVRAMAESGLDFTTQYQGPSGKNEMSGYASLLLNALLAGFAQDVAWLAALAGMSDTATQFDGLSQARKAAIRTHLWDDESDHHRSLHLPTSAHNSGTDFTIYAPLFAGIATQEEADRIALAGKTLHHAYGVAASDDYASPHQWDGLNGWAPAQMMAVSGLNRYGHEIGARDLARRWTQGVANSFSQQAAFYERLNVGNAAPPALQDHQYPVQEGFLWTNASFAWLVLDVLNLPVSQINSSIDAKNRTSAA